MSVWVEIPQASKVALTGDSVLVCILALYIPLCPHSPVDLLVVLWSPVQGSLPTGSFTEVGSSFFRGKCRVVHGYGYGSGRAWPTPPPPPTPALSPLPPLATYVKLWKGRHRHHLTASIPPQNAHPRTHTPERTQPHVLGFFFKFSLFLVVTNFHFHATMNVMGPTWPHRILPVHQPSVSAPTATLSHPNVRGINLKIIVDSVDKS